MRPVLTVGLATMVLPGCASLDPAADLEAAATLVEDRAGTTTGWSSPWNEWADAWDGRAPLSSDAAVRVALQNNRGIRREVETIVASRADFVQAHLLPNPVLNVLVGFPTDGLGGTPAMITLVQQLSWLWMRPAAIDAAEAGLRARVLAVSDAALRLATEVRQAHAAVVVAEQAVDLQRQNLALLERSADLTRTLRDVGEATGFDVNRLALDEQNARIELADRGAALERAKRRMLDLLARADAPADWTSDGVLPEVADSLAGFDEARVVELASVQRLDVAAAEAVVSFEVARLEAANLGAIPDISAGIGYQQNFSDREALAPVVRVALPIFDDNRARIARAASELEQALIAADGVRQKAVGEARTAWVDVHAHAWAVAAYEASVVDLAATNVELARLGYEVGETELTALLDAQRQLNDARLRLADRRLDAVGSLFELQRAVGGAMVGRTTLAVLDPPRGEVSHD